jgi:pyruvate/2-oxoglutarate dehydrogenase complex dihydrolipoamide acyltransferase (E2) component
MLSRTLASALLILALPGCRTANPATPAAPAAPPAQPQAAAPQPAAAEPERYENTLRWSTASEVDNFGYDVYRATTAEGPFERITRDPVAGAGTTDVPQLYSYVDSSIDPHQAYYYYVESISFSGVRERFTPVITAKPKLPPGGPSSPP